MFQYFGPDFMLWAHKKKATKKKKKKTKTTKEILSS